MVLMSSYNVLVCVPEVEPFEAVSSWICRLALSQGASPGDICDYLEVSATSDIDLQFYGARLAQLRALCGLPAAAFHVHDKVVSSLIQAAVPANKLLAREGGRFMRYRYCVQCLMEMKTPNYPIHWRFVPWRWCPIHDSLMESECQTCRSSLLLLRDLAIGGKARQGLGSLSRCLSCGERLAAREPCNVGELPPEAITVWEKYQLSNGRALLAALYHGKFRFEDQSGSKTMGSLYRALRTVSFSTKFDYISANTVRQRSKGRERTS